MATTDFSLEQKRDIARRIKPISLEDATEEFAKLCDIGPHLEDISERCRIGNNVVDYFTFAERLETRGKYNTNYYEFVANMGYFTEKKFIRTMLNYYKREKNKNGKKNVWVVLKEVYNICISPINIIRPLVYMEIYAKYQPLCVLDFCAGWGGAVTAAAALNVPRYVGIEINTDLREPYQRLCAFLQDQGTQTEMDLRFQDALTVDYAAIEYDLVFTSPPYYFIQKYKHNKEYKKGKDEMDAVFYRPLFLSVYRHLKPGGHFILNVNQEVYNRVCVDLLGPAHETGIYKKSKRQNNYQETVYRWTKPASASASA